MERSTVSINKKIVDKTQIVEVSGDIIVPDIKPDIVNIIHTNGNAYIYKEDIVQGRVRIDGNVDTYVVYLSENGETRSMQTTLNFIETIDDTTIKENMITKQKVSIENIETKILNERKITIKVNLKIKCECYEKSEIEFLNDLQEMQDVQKLQESITVKSVLGINKIKTSIKEDIHIDDALEIAEILKTDITLCNMENKISYNKVLAKADANVKIIFLTEDERVSCVESTIPMMSFIDMENVTENNICHVSYTIRNMLFKVNTKEMHSVSCQVDFEVLCEAYESKTMNVIQDMYGIKNDIAFSKKQVEVQVDGEERQESIKINETILMEDIHSIYSVDCTPKILSTHQVGNFTNYEGELSLDFYYEADNRTGLNVKNVKLPFITKMESVEEIEITVMKKDFTIHNENVDCDIELLAKQRNMCLKTINIIENIESKECEEENDYKMYVYFVKSGDTIWNIAKKFRVCMEDIIRVNQLEDDRIAVGDRLYIMR